MIRGSFNKPVLSLSEKITLLEERGLKIDDKKKTLKYLQHIGYFRMTGYFKYFQNVETDQFILGTTFKKVLQYYIFDRKLRLLTLDAIEKIEVSIKSNISDYMSKKYGAFWYADASNFITSPDRRKKIYDGFHKKITEKFDKSESQSTAIFIKEYFRKYSEKYLPSWMLFEDLTIGEVATVYKLIKSEDAKEIAKQYGIYFYDLELRLHLINNTRNISAHHGRLWNRKFIFKPRMKDSIYRGIFPLIQKEGREEVLSNFYTVSLIIHYLLFQINENNTWIDRLESLFLEFGIVNKSSMGFEDDRKKYFT